jgi:hypothetical protein
MESRKQELQQVTIYHCNTALHHHENFLYDEGLSSLSEWMVMKLYSKSTNN